MNRQVKLIVINKFSTLYFHFEDVRYKVSFTDLILNKKKVKIRIDKKLVGYITNKGYTGSFFSMKGIEKNEIMLFERNDIVELQNKCYSLKVEDSMVSIKLSKRSYYAIFKNNIQIGKIEFEGALRQKAIISFSNDKYLKEILKLFIVACKVNKLRSFDGNPFDLY